MWQSENFCKIQNVRKTKINFLPDEITTACFETQLTLMMTMTKLPSLNNVKPDITECFMIIVIKQPNKTLWFGVKINGLII